MLISNFFTYLFKGISGLAPKCVIISAEQAAPSFPARSKSKFLDKPAKKPAAKKSPAPVVSITLAGSAIIS